MTGVVNNLHSQLLALLSLVSLSSLSLLRHNLYVFLLFLVPFFYFTLSFWYGLSALLKVSLSADIADDLMFIFFEWL